jgi:hypothetical protein
MGLDWFDYYAFVINNPRDSKLKALKRFRPGAIEASEGGSPPDLEQPPDVGQNKNEGRGRRAASEPEPGTEFEVPVVEDDNVTVTRTEDGLQIDIAVDTGTAGQMLDSASGSGDSGGSSSEQSTGDKSKKKKKK